MRKGYVYITLLIIPILTIIYTIQLKNSVGPFYQNSQYDPSYVYLINSLNIAELVSPAHVDHPGTPLQITGALVIRALYLINGKSVNIAEDVIMNPEHYLDFILYTLLVINFGVLFISALIIYKATENVYAAILIQLSPFLSFSISYSFFTVTPENLLIPVSMLLIAYSIKFIFDRESKNQIKYLIIFAVISGIGLAVKINFFPLIFIPLIILKRFTRKIIFLILTLIFFAVSIIPAFSKLEYFTGWTGRLFLNDGIYGSGKSGIIDTGLFFQNLITIFSSEIYFSIIYFVIFLTLIIYLFRRSKFTEKNDISGIAKLLTAIFISMTLQIIMVSKHYNNRYMLPGLILGISGLVLCILLNKKLFYEQLKNINLNYIYLTFIVLLSVMTVRDTYYNYTGLKMISDDSKRLVNLMKNKTGDKTVINSFGVSSEEYALAFSSKYAGKNTGKYKKIIEILYPGNLYFESWNKNIYSLSENNNISSMLHNGNQVFIRSASESSTDLILKDLNENYDIKDPEMTEIGSTQAGEKVYELKLK